MTEPNINQSPNLDEIAASTAAGAQKRLDKILDLWRIGLRDTDRSIRLFTLMATVSGFFLMFVLILFSGQIAVCAIQGCTVKVHWYLFTGGGAVVPVFVLAFPAAWRKSERVNAELLEAGFENVYSSRYSTRVNQ